MARTRPHFKSHVSMRTHPKTAAMYADNDLLAAYHRIGHFLVERFAGRTGGYAIVSGSDLTVLTGTRQVSGAVQRLKKLAACSPVVFIDPREVVQSPSSTNPVPVQLPPSIRPVLAQLPASATKVWVLGMPNFSEKQGFAQKNPTRMSKEPDTSESDSESDTEEERERAAPPGAGGQQNTLSLDSVSLIRMVEGQPGEPTAKAAWAAEERDLIALEAAKEADPVADPSGYRRSAAALAIRYWRAWRGTKAADPHRSPAVWQDSDEAREIARKRSEFEAMTPDQRAELVAKSRALPFRRSRASREVG